MTKQLDALALDGDDLRRLPLSLRKTNPAPAGAATGFQLELRHRRQ
jgi:hypothetical protein